MMKKAVVVGGTGALGREVVGTLLTSGQWSQVVTVGRRAVEVPAAYPPSAFKGTLEQVVVNMDNLETEGAAAFQGAHAVFCTLGTTRKDAGSAEAFVKVDRDYVAKSAVAAKAAAVPYFALVTCQAANANYWTSIPGMLYLRTKGQAEEAVKAQKLPHVAIYRPGMLDRGDLKRDFVEKSLCWLTTGILTADLARCMVKDAERAVAMDKPLLPSVLSLYTNAALHAAVKAKTYAAAPEAGPSC